MAVYSRYDPPPTHQTPSRRRRCPHSALTSVSLVLRVSLLVITLSSLCGILPTTHAAMKNATIDDEYGDELFSQKPQFLPRDTGIWEGEECGGCRVKPDPQFAFRSTYNAATWRPDSDGTRRPREITFQFTGTALYVFLTLAHNAGEGITTRTEANFTVDDNAPFLFVHRPDMSRTDFDYQYLAYSIQDLEHRTHQFSAKIDGTMDYDIFINFDYAIYTYDDTLIGTQTSTSFPNSPATGTPSGDGNSSGSGGSSLAGPIAGGVVGGLAVLVLFIVALIFIRRRSRREEEARLNPHAVQKEYPNPEIFAFTGHLNTGPGSTSSFSGVAGGGTVGAGRAGFGHRPAQPSTTVTTSSDWSSGYLPASSSHVTPYGYQPSSPSGGSVGAGTTLAAGGAAARSVQTTRSADSGGSTSKAEMRRREEQRRLESQHRHMYQPVRKHPVGEPQHQEDPPLYPPHQYANTSRSDSPFDPASLYSGTTAVTSRSNERPQINTAGATAASSAHAPSPNPQAGGGGPSTSTQARIQALQNSISALEHSIHAESEAMRDTGMSEAQIGSNAALRAMKESLRVMREQMRTLQGRSSVREDLPEYESLATEGTLAGSVARRGSMEKR